MHAVFRRTLFGMLLTVLLAMGTLPAGAQPRMPSEQERLGYAASARLLIIHADDFGMSHSVTWRSPKHSSNGWVTSASVMVPCPWFPEVLQWAKAHPRADLGLTPRAQQRVAGLPVGTCVARRQGLKPARPRGILL